MKILLGFCICLLFSAVRARELADVVGDTSWLVRGGRNQRTMLHICREAEDTRPVNIEYGNGSLVLKDTDGGCFAGVNGRGVAMSVSEGDPNSDPVPAGAKSPLSGPQIVEKLLGPCGTAQQAMDEIRKIFDAGRISGGWIFFLTDPKRSFVVECSSRHFAATELHRAFCVYANSWKLPGMDEASTAASLRAYTVYQKEWAASELLRRALTAHRGITVADSIAVSRFDRNDLNADEFTKARDPKDGRSKIEISVHNDKSAGGFILEVDGEFPDMLSCVYAAFGAPRGAVHLPIPIGAAHSLLDCNISPGAQDKLDPKLARLESALLSEFGSVREDARKLLREGKRPEAANLLIHTMMKQAEAALLRNAK